MKDNQRLAKRTTQVQDEKAAGELMQLPAWLQTLRDSMADSIKSDDLQQIMAAQVAKAKDGDMRAANFVFGQAHKLLASERRQVSITQNNYYETTGDKRPDVPASAEPGTSAKIAKMTARAAAGLPLDNASDRGFGRPMSDEEEKELRRQEDAVGND